MDNFGPPLYIIIPFAIIFILIFCLSIYGIIHGIRMQRRLMANGGVITSTVAVGGGLQQQTIVVSPPRPDAVTHSVPFGTTQHNMHYGPTQYNVPFGPNQYNVPYGSTQPNLPHGPSQHNFPYGSNNVPHGNSTNPFSANSENAMGAPPPYSSNPAGGSQGNFHTDSANNIGRHGDVEKGYDR